MLFDAASQLQRIRLIAFDLDGTLTQHRTKLGDENRAVLEKLAKKYKLIMIGAGACMRIFGQMNEFPIDIIGNYGMQISRYNKETKQLDIIETAHVEPDRARTERICAEIREKYGFTEYTGDAVEFHASGMITFPLLGTKANIEDKLAFDPDRSKRRKIYAEVCDLFPEYVVFVGGSSSFDMAPKPYNKYYALDLYCKEKGIAHDEVIFVGDDYGMGGNDESVYLSDFSYITIDNYLDFPKVMSVLL